MIYPLLKNIKSRVRAKWLNVIENPHRQVFGEFYYRIPLEEKVVALTYDDGPYEPYTNNLLSVLDRHEIKATFFFVGNKIEKYLEAAKLAHQKGHQIANHSYSHPKLTFKSPSFVRKEIEKTDRLIRSIGVNYEIVFRAPFGNKFLVLPYMLWRLGKKHILFDFFPNPRDWWGSKPEEVVWSILEQTRPGSIIVLHDGNPTAAPLVCEYTDLLITKLKQKGYRFETVKGILELGRKIKHEQC